MTPAGVDVWDPRTWAADWTPGVPPLAAARASGVNLRSPLAGLLTAAAILTTGAVAAWMSRPAEPTPVASPAIGSAPGKPPAPAAPGQVRRTLKLSNAADLADALTRSGVPADVVQQVVAAALPALQPTGDIRAVLTLVRDGDSFLLERLEASNRDSSGVVVNRASSGELTVSRVAAQLDARILVKHGTMDDDSFYSSAVAAGVPNSLIPVFAKVLAFDFNFQTEVTAGDAFELAYAQRVNAAGEEVGAPQLLYASLTTATTSAAVYRFTPPGGAEEWFDSSGRSIVRALMRTPVDGARVTSKFGMRFHPVLHFKKMHGGIDFAAPTGTPVYAAGGGVIEFAGPRGAAGNFISLQHDNGWRTTYMHLHRFAPGIGAGTRVAQGQPIGEVGTTGRSTGPHLHYEVIIDGQKVDPLSIETDAQKVLDGAALLAFERVRDQIDVSRAGSSG